MSAEPELEPRKVGQWSARQERAVAIALGGLLVFGLSVLSIVMLVWASPLIYLLAL